MKTIQCAVLIGFIGATGVAGAAELSTTGGVLGGLGVNYVAKFVPTQLGKGKTASIAPLSLQSDDTILSPSKDPAETVTIARTKSMGWNDPAVNFRGACSKPATPPDPKQTLADANTVNCIPDNGYGWGHNSQWYLVDLNELAKAGVKAAHISIMVNRVNDGVAQEQAKDSTGKLLTNEDGSPKFEPSDDDIVPALTVWRGFQDTGKHMHWYPQKYQNFAANKPADEKTFWANKLSPAPTDEGEAWATAFDAATQDEASVHIVTELDKKDPSKNYLTIAIGGDGRHVFPAGNAKQGQVDSTQKHDVNFKLTVATEALKSIKAAK
jgi:hypothetical protein